MNVRPISWIGIDPGLEGAVVMLNHAGVVFAFHRTPVFKPTKGRTVHNVGECARMLRTLHGLAGSLDSDLRIAIEDVSSRPGQGVVSMFSFGVGYGLWQGISASLDVPVLRVKPKGWQDIALAGRSRKDVKQTALVVASELFPSLAIRDKRDQGLADAALIAEACRRAHSR